MLRFEILEKNDAQRIECTVGGLEKIHTLFWVNGKLRD